MEVLDIRATSDAGYTIVPNHIMRCDKLNSSEFRVFLCLLSYANRTSGKAWPSYNTIQGCTGISRATIARAMASLKEKGLVEVVGGNNGVQVVTLNMDWEGWSQNEMGGGLNLRRGGSQNETQQIRRQVLDNKTPLTPLEGGRFEEFWKAYPKKQAKKPAQKVFTSLKITDDMFRDLMAGLQALKETEQWMKDGGKYVPLPVTFLRQERWTDEVVVAEDEVTPEEKALAMSVYERISRAG